MKGKEKIGFPEAINDYENLSIFFSEIRNSTSVGTGA